MAVLLSILKIIGIVILCLIALILLIAALILFVPVRYKIRADKPLGNDFKASVKVSYLLHMLSGAFIYDEEKDLYLKLFGFRIWPKKKKDDPDTGHMTDTEQMTQKPGDDDISIDWNEPDTESSAPTTPDDVSPEDTSGKDEQQEQVQCEDNGPGPDLADKIAGFFEKITDKYEALSDRYEGLRRKARFWEKMINDERNREAVGYIKVKTLRLLKKIAPRSVKGFVHFGFDDPATTGKILMYLALVYPVLPKKLKVDPSFEDADIYGDLTVKGRICIITPVMFLAGLYFNKDCKRMWRLYKKHNGK